MEIFYIAINEFKERCNKDFLNCYCDIKSSNEKRIYEYAIGRYLVKNVAKQVYNINDVEIVLNNSKPVFKKPFLHFNISHSKDIVVACFDKNPCGVDIEFAKERDLTKLSNFFNIYFKNSEEFYKFWTYKEASYKLQDTVKDSFFLKFKDDYYLTAVSNTAVKELIKIFKFNF